MKRSNLLIHNNRNDKQGIFNSVYGQYWHQNTILTVYLLVSNNRF